MTAEVKLADHWDGIAPFLAGGANVALQMLGAPGVAYGVMESRVESGRVDRHPIKRGRTTITYLAVAAFGTDEERAAYRAAVDAVHRHVRSGPDSPVAYSAFDPDLQLWVAACLYVGWRDVHERLRGRLDDATTEAIYQRSAVLGTTLQMRVEAWPATRAAFDAWFADRLATSRVDAATAAFCRGLIRLEFAPRWLAPVVPFLAFTNTGFTPAFLRERLDLSWGPRRERVFRILTRTLGWVSRRLPGPVRNAPFLILLADVRRRRRLGRPLV